MPLRFSYVLLGLACVTACRSAAVATRPPRTCTVSSAQSRIGPQYAPGAGGIYGRVVAVGNAAPIPQAEFQVESTRHRVATDSAGHFRIDLPSGSYALRIRAFGYQEVRDTIRLPGLDGFELLAVLARPLPGLIGCRP